MANPDPANAPKKMPAWGTLEYLQEALETLLDDYGFQNVLDELSTACQQKADYLNSEWEDYKGAVLWGEYASALRGLAFQLFHQKDRR